MTHRLLLFLSLAALLVSPSLGANAVDVEVAENPTYSRDVASILNERCVSCHRPDQGAPMTLQSYEEVRPWVKSIARNLEEGTMPPWHVVASVGALVDDRSLEDWEKETVLRWVKQGAAEGDVADLPSAPTFPTGEWKLGEPDFIVTLPEVVVPAGGPDVFENLTGKIMLPEDRWLKAVEILPGNPKVVHHVIAFQVKGFNVDPEQGWLGAWAAGTEPMVFPPGTAREITKGANLIGDMHYHPAETEERDVAISDRTDLAWQFRNPAEGTSERQAELRQRYDLRREAFNTGLMAFGTDVIRDDTLAELQQLYLRYEGLHANADQGVLNLYFYERWRRVPDFYAALRHVPARHFFVPKHEFRTIGRHFVGHPRVWHEENPWHPEWKRSLARFDSIDASRPQPPARVWSDGEIHRYWAWLHARRLLSCPSARCAPPGSACATPPPSAASAAPGAS